MDKLFVCINYLTLNVCVMSTIIFVCVLDVILNVVYSKYKANRVRKQGLGKVCRGTIVEKWKKLTKEEKR